MACINCSLDLHNDECVCNGEIKCNKCENCNWCIKENVNVASTDVNGKCVPSAQFTKENCAGSFKDTETKTEDKLKDMVDERKEQDNDTREIDSDQNDLIISDNQRNSDSDYRLDKDTPNLINPNNTSDTRIKLPSLNLSFSNIVFYIIIAVLLIISFVCIILIIFSNKYRNMCIGNTTTNRLSFLNSKIKEKKKMIFNAILRSKQT
tara:strand:- start:1233 stop:1853 length:621 start_codon:yes stop_codon:yes gene_type:complete